MMNADGFKIFIQCCLWYLFHFLLLLLVWMLTGNVLHFTLRFIFRCVVLVGIDSTLDFLGSFYNYWATLICPPDQARFQIGLNVNSKRKVIESCNWPLKMIISQKVPYYQYLQRICKLVEWFAEEHYFFRLASGLFHIKDRYIPLFVSILEFMSISCLFGHVTIILSTQL